MEFKYILLLGFLPVVLIGELILKDLAWRKSSERRQKRSKDQ